MNTYKVTNKHGQEVLTKQFPVALKLEFEALGFTVETVEPLVTVKGIQDLAHRLEEAHK